MNVDGTEFIQLTHNSEIKCCLAWSPDGQKLVFKADRDIYLVNADGNNLTKLVDITPTDGDGDWHDFPVWSPDSQQILFASYYLSPHLNLTTPADGGLTGLTNAPIFPEMGHTWSPDGQHIAFTSGHDDESEIYVINATDTNLTKLTNNTVKDWGPVWSPDGQSIAFISEQQDELAEIYLTHADGSNQRRLTESSGRYTGNPVWSPDSHHIAYTSQHLNDDEWIYWIHIINAAGTGQQQLVKGTEPAWSPDGQYIVFVDVDLKISVMDAGGVQAIKLPIPLPYTAAPTWQPSPPRLWGSDKVFDDKAWSPTPTVLPEVAAIPVTSTQSFRLDEFSPRLIDDDSERIYTTGYVDGIDNPQTLVLNLADERLLARYDIAGGLALDTGCVQKFR
jgi:Tol biopolymer transport system component